MKKFERHGSGRRNQADKVGRVQIRIVMFEHGAVQATKGNITRTVSVSDTKVSEVYAAVERALFGKEDA